MIPPLKSLPLLSARIGSRCVALVLCLVAWGGVLHAAPAAPPFRADRILVMPKPDAPRADIGAFHAATGARVFRQFSAMQNLQVLQLPPGSNPEEFVDRYQKSGLVSFAELDLAVSIAVSPNDPYYSSGALWHLHNTTQPGADIHAPEGWDILRSASNLIVAVVDTGVRYTHQDLAANMWVNSGEIPGNGIDDDADGFIDDVYGINAAANTGDPMDTLGHGTQVAGYVGAVGNNSLGVVGVAWRVQIMACRFFDDAGNGNISDVIQCFDYARAHGAKVINASFISTSYSSSFYTAINSCRSAGIILVAAAGNDTVNTDATPYYPACYNLDNIVSVAATTSADGIASFSNYGATSVDLGAPGLSLYSTARDSDSSYVQNSGTSFSSPIVAGAMALVRARYPAETYRQHIDRVLAAVDPLPALAGKCVTGGRLNLARALGPVLVANFAMSASSGVLPLVVNFTNTSFGAITNWLWQFGDGATSTAQNPAHTYTNGGTFTVTLTVKNDVGLTDSTNRTVIAVANYQMTNATFAWIDPSSMSSLGLIGDDVSAPQTLPFPFQFYGQAYSSLYVGANGLIGFSVDGLSTAANTDLPVATLPNNIICPFWDDLSPSASSVRMGTVGAAPDRKVVISWVSAPASGGGSPASFTFQVVLSEASNTILFQYLDVQPSSRNGSAAGKRATVGVEHVSGLVARKYSYNGSTLLANNQAILFTPTSSSVVANSPPVVAITNLTNGTVLSAPASLTVAASASDNDGAVAQVEFFLGGTSIGIDTSSPYSAVTNNVSAGTYTVSAVATDNAGAKATNSVSIIVNSLPTASLTSPTNGATFIAPASITLTATASDSDGTVTNVEFFNGLTLLGNDTNSPYSISWNNVAAGSYTLTVKAMDNRGAVTTSSAVSITVSNNAAPTVTVTSPTNNTLLAVPASFTLTATASDPDGGVAQVEFFNGGTSLGFDTNSPYSVPVNNLTAGIYTLTAVATDNRGATATNSVSLIVNSLPTISITSPTNGAIFLAPANIAIAVTANDSDGTVTNVEFFQGATKLGQDTNSPFTFAWNGVTAGIYTLTARATDNRGAMTTSASINISVTNSPPSPVTLVNPQLGVGGFTFSFLTTTGQTYHVEFNSLLGTTNWQALTNFVGNGSTAIITDPDTGAMQRFYRVGAQ